MPADWEADTEGSDDICDTNQELQSPGGPECHVRARVLVLGGPEYTKGERLQGLAGKLGVITT